MENKTGLILEGGAMRGLFTAGVLDVFMENGITFDGAVGVSAGAAFGCNIKSGQVGRVLRYNKKYCRDKRFGGWYSLITTGDIYGADFCYNEIPQKLDPFDEESYEANPMEFHIVCTDVNTGKPVYKKCDNLIGENMEWIRGSASMPLVSRMVKSGGYTLLDGGVSDSIPVKYFESLGFNKQVAVLTRPRNYIKAPNKLIPLAKLRYRKYPNLINAMANRHIDYNKTVEYINKKEADGKIIVIRPKSDLPMKHMEKDPLVLEKVYNLGREAATEKLSEINEFLRSERQV